MNALSLLQYKYMQNTIDFGSILTDGEAFYFESLKNKLEKNNFGEYLVIDVDSKQYVLNKNKIEAIDEAERKFGKKLFYIVQVGYLDEPTVNFRERKNVAWIF